MGADCAKNTENAPKTFSRAMIVKNTKKDGERNENSKKV